MNSPVRTFHRWTAITFVAGFVTYMLAMIGGTPPAWVGLLALVPLILLMVSGLYMFFQHFVAKARDARHQSEPA